MITRSIAATALAGLAFLAPAGVHAAAPPPAAAAPAPSVQAAPAPSVPAEAAAPPAAPVATPTAPPGGDAAAPAVATPTEAAASAAAPAAGAAMRAIEGALAAARLGATEPLDTARIGSAVAAAEAKLARGRRDEAIAELLALVEARRFDPFRELDEGRSALFALGEALGRAGALGPARGYLAPLLRRAPLDVWARKAARALVDLGLSADRPGDFLSDLRALPPGAPAELTSDVAFLAGRTAHREGRDDVALAELARVTPRSRFWAQATYLAGLVHAGHGRLAEGERQFCKVADVRKTPREALAFGGGDFFVVRDLARLGLGRLAHEQYRFDDARYYYYLVPHDSDHVQEALYESATSRYEAKDYQGARELLDELHGRGGGSRYDDEVWILDAYVDLALCRFPAADEKLRRFIARYEPVRDAARRVARDPAALSDLASAVRSGADPASLLAPEGAAALSALGSVLRADPDHARESRRLADLDLQLRGLRQAMGELDDARARLASAKDVRPRTQTAITGGAGERGERVSAQLAEVRRLLRAVRGSGGKGGVDVKALEDELARLEARARDASATEPPAGAAASSRGVNLPDLVVAERERASALHRGAEAVRATVLDAQLAAARSALERLDLRLSRLVRRARLGRIETVLGKKRAVELEIEALTEGFLPQGAVDSLDAARYLRDDEEYWPSDGEDWADEYVGGEGLR